MLRRLPAFLTLTVAAVSGVVFFSHTAKPHAHSITLDGIHKIRHVVVIMQENRSFDSYFGTYPGADGIPGLAGNPGTVPCSPDPKTKTCVRPYHDTADINAGGPHSESSGIHDIAGGKMNGFQAEARSGRVVS